MTDIPLCAERAAVARRTHNSQDTHFLYVTSGATSTTRRYTLYRTAYKLQSTDRGKQRTARPRAHGAVCAAPHNGPHSSQHANMDAHRLQRSSAAVGIRPDRAKMVRVRLAWHRGMECMIVIHAVRIVRRTRRSRGHRWRKPAREARSSFASPQATALPTPLVHANHTSRTTGTRRRAGRRLSCRGRDLLDTLRRRAVVKGAPSPRSRPG